MVNLLCRKHSGSGGDSGGDSLSARREGEGEVCFGEM